MTEILKLISDGHHLVLNQLAGKKTFAKAKDIFSFVDPYFLRKHLKSETATPKRTIGIYETVPGSKFTLMEMFAATPGTWNKKWFSESQITKICKHFKHWLRNDGYSNYVLCNTGDYLSVYEDEPHKSLVVVLISYSGNDIQITKIDLDDPGVRRGDFKLRVIVPKVRVKK